MSIKKTRPKRIRPSSNLTIRMAEDRMTSDRMGSDKMMSDRGPGSLGGIQRPSVRSANHTSATKKTER